MDGCYMDIGNEAALSSFYPQVLFYRLIDEKREYFTYSGYAVPEKPKTPKSNHLEDWGDVAPLAKTINFDEVQASKQKMIEKLFFLEQ